VFAKAETVSNTDFGSALLAALNSAPFHSPERRRSSREGLVMG